MICTPGMKHSRPPGSDRAALAPQPINLRIIPRFHARPGNRARRDLCSSQRHRGTGSVLSAD
jgi:hypothetical protein